MSPSSTGSSPASAFSAVSLSTAGAGAGVVVVREATAAVTASTALETISAIWERGARGEEGRAKGGEDVMGGRVGAVGGADKRLAAESTKSRVGVVCQGTVSAFFAEKVEVQGHDTRIWIHRRSGQQQV